MEYEFWKLCFQRSFPEVFREILIKKLWKISWETFIAECSFWPIASYLTKKWFHQGCFQGNFMKCFKEAFLQTPACSYFHINCALHKSGYYREIVYCHAALSDFFPICKMNQRVKIQYKCYTFWLTLILSHMRWLLKTVIQQVQPGF